MGSVAELSSRMLRPGFHPPELEGETVLFLFLLYHASKPGGQQQGSRCSSRLPFHLILLENTGKQGTLPVFLLTSTIPGVGTRGSPASTGTCPSEQVSPELSVPSPLCPHCVPPTTKGHYYSIRPSGPSVVTGVFQILPLGSFF